jgi:hypothetical protein
MGALLNRYPATLASVTSLVVLTALFWLSGALFPVRLPEFATSSREVVGMVWVLILAPAYIAGASVVMQRRSLSLVDQLRPFLDDPAAADAAVREIQSGLARSWPWGALLGIAFGVFNSQPVYAFLTSTTPSVDIPISLGQILLWLAIGLNGGARTMAARAFDRLGAAVDFDIFHLDRLRPLARSGLIDVVVIAVGLIFTPLQSLDAEFRWYNYSSPLLILLPGG